MRKTSLLIALVLILGSASAAFAQKVVTGPKIKSSNYEIVHPKGLVLDIQGYSKKDAAFLHLWKRHGKWNQAFRPIEAPDGCYYLMNEGSGKFVDVRGQEIKNGAYLHMLEVHSKEDQLFRFHDAGGGFYHIEAYNSGLFLAAKDNPPKKRTRIILVDKNRADRWKLNFVSR